MASFILGLSFANSGRYSGLSGDNPNWIAITLALGIPIAWHLASMYRNAWLSWINFFYLPTSLLAIGLTASRGGFINALVGMSLILFSFRSLSLTRKAFLLFLIPIGIYGVLNTVPPENLTRLSEASAEISEGDMTSRGAIWAAGLRIIAERPWLGYGIGSFSTAVASELGSAMNAHNSFISIMAELGVVGIMLFVLLFLLSVLPFFLPNTSDRWFYLVLWASLITANIPAAWEYNKITWVLLSLMTTRKALVVAVPLLAPSSTPTQPPQPLTASSQIH